MNDNEKPISGSPDAVETAAPGRELLPYQKTWANDKSRWKFGLMSRQVGKDFGAGFEGVRECFEADLQGKKVDWLIAAPSERQSLESLDKWKYWCESFDIALDGEELERDGKEGLLKSATIILPHGSRIIAVPGRPDTVRGYSANVLLTEFAFFENPDATWRAILPSVTNPLRGGQKKIRLITTPNGIGNKAHDIWSKNFKGQPPLSARSGERADAKARGEVSPEPLKPSKWSCHLVDIHTAVAQGLPIDIEELKSGIDDAEGWAQEYECQFLDTQSVLLPYDLIAHCESAEATASLPGEFWQSTPQWPIDIGIDFGRRKDLTVCWSNARIGDVSHTIEVLELANMSTPDQVEILRPRLKQARRVCLDYTGAGVGMGDYLVNEFHEWKPAAHKFGKIELCTFSESLKIELFSKLRMTFEKRAVRVPVNCAVREDLHSVTRVTSDTGGITYRAPRGAGGHADRCTALALALRARQGEANPGAFHLFDNNTSAPGLVAAERRPVFP